MKKIYLLTLLLAFASFTFAQSKTGSALNVQKVNQKITVNSSKATGDTLMHFDGSAFAVNSTDATAFGFVNEDLDLLTAYNAASGWTSDWMGFYSVDPADFLHTDVDSAHFIGSTSWFNPAGQSDDWFSFGPITLTAGADLTWAVKCNSGYRDGYKVFVSSTGMSNYTDFTSTPLYSRTDLYPNTNDAVDTVWTYYTVSIPTSYSGGQIYVGFQHYALDMDVLFLDEMSLIEKPLGISEASVNGIKLSQNQPNPANGVTLVHYELDNAAKVTLDIFDISGRLVFSTEEGMQNAGSHNINIDVNKIEKGTYFYSLKADNNRLTKKMIIL
jgi:hypothetical protein